MVLIELEQARRRAASSPARSASTSSPPPACPPPSCRATSALDRGRHRSRHALPAAARLGGQVRPLHPGRDLRRRASTCAPARRPSARAVGAELSADDRPRLYSPRASPTGCRPWSTTPRCTYLVSAMYAPGSRARPAATTTPPSGSVWPHPGHRRLRQGPFVARLGRPTAVDRAPPPRRHRDHPGQRPAQAGRGRPPHPGRHGRRRLHGRSRSPAACSNRCQGIDLVCIANRTPERADEGLRLAGVDDPASVDTVEALGRPSPAAARLHRATPVLCAADGIDVVLEVTGAIDYGATVVARSRSSTASTSSCS